MAGTITVLIIEEDMEMNLALKQTLRAQGFFVSSAASLNAAYTTLEVIVPDILILDLELPDGNGADLLPMLESPAYDDMRMVMLADHPDSYEHLYTDYEAASFLLKPVSVRGLAMLIDSLVEPDIISSLTPRRHRRDAYELATRTSTQLARAV
jgi:DNA-binding response OmpR family regulator